MGLTLRRALAMLRQGAESMVAKIVPAILAWARGPLTELTAGCLIDPPVRVVEGDVAAVIAEGAGAYDAITLDVDNGPDGPTRVGNDRLYRAGGLAAARGALRPGGRLALWSAAPDAAFAKRFASARFKVTEPVVRTRQIGKGGATSSGLAFRPI